MDINYWIEEVLKLYRDGCKVEKAIEIVKERMNSETNGIR